MCWAARSELMDARFGETDMPASLCLCLCKTCSDGCVSPTVMCQVCRSSRDGICSCTGRSKCRDRQSMKALPANKPETVRSKNECSVRVGHLSEFARGIDGFNNATICQGLCFWACPLLEPNLSATHTAEPMCYSALVKGPAAYVTEKRGSSDGTSQTEKTLGSKIAPNTPKRRIF